MFFLVCENCPNKFHVVDLSTACVHCFQQLVHFLVAHLLSQVCQDVSQLAHANESCHIFVEHLEAAAVFLGLARISEAARSVEYFLE